MMRPSRRDSGTSAGRLPAIALVALGAALLAAAVPLSLADPPAGGPVNPKARPTTRVVNCTDGGCHATQIDHKVLHGPTAIGACDTCHEVVAPAEHTFKMKRPDQTLCTFCHVGLELGKVVHKPVADGQCLGCHDPHGATNKQLLRADNPGKLCATCHGDVTQGRKQVHGPVAAGNCVTCHNAHSSPFPRLLSAEGRALCLGCHEQMGRQLKEVKFVHEPAKGNCLDCHEPHASNHMMQLKKEPVDLCGSCHGPVLDQARSASHKHDPVLAGNACVNCHTPHGSDLAKLMRGRPAKMCLTCHDKPIETAGGEKVISVAEIGKPGEYLHGPIRDGNCSGCHEVHGGKLSRLLTKPYPETFYEPFRLDAYAMCFSCHEKEMVLTPRTVGLTRFRDGDFNLHYLHVNKADRGRSCRACHSTHASDHPLHIRDSVPYGNWQMPINFEPNASGGACSPGCHKKLTYNRVEAANAHPTPPAGPPPRPTTQPHTTTTEVPTTQQEERS